MGNHHAMCFQIITPDEMKSIIFSDMYETILSHHSNSFKRILKIPVTPDRVRDYDAKDIVD